MTPASPSPRGAWVPGDRVLLTLGVPPCVGGVLRGPHGSPGSTHIPPCPHRVTAAQEVTQLPLLVPGHGCPMHLVAVVAIFPLALFPIKKNPLSSFSCDYIFFSGSFCNFLFYLALSSLILMCFVRCGFLRAS